MSAKPLTEAYHYNDQSSTITTDPGFLKRTHTIYFTFEISPIYTSNLNFFLFCLFLSLATVNFQDPDFHVQIFQ